MPTPWDRHLSRWQRAGLVDDATAGRIRAFEQEHGGAASRWARIAAALGAGLLGAGVLLFISAHWDELSPGVRMALAVAPIVAFHALGAFATVRGAPSLASAAHAVGTISLGAAIALAGQIFNLAEHWPAAVLFWAVGAAAGWVLLRDWPQAALTAVLVPAWLVGEWVVATEDLSAPRVAHPVAAGTFLLALAYLTARRDADDGHVRRALGWVGGLALLPLALLLVAISTERGGIAPGGALAFGWTVAMLLPLAVAVAFRGKDAWLNVVAALWAVAVVLVSGSDGAAYRRGPGLAVYALCALGAAGLVAWGVREQRAERINLGLAGFTITVLGFYFSSVMDKLGRSASLVTLGALLLAGGWALERTRRTLIAGIDPAGGAR
ncbi:MAG TPA: DUF2157 domain-containing protein [Gemmatimonadaceae bacterium]|nr:DUF2157 domain-containing protein [Gemmatimonadaceae bacterium]